MAIGHHVDRKLIPLALLLFFASLTASLTLVGYEEIIAHPIQLPDADRLVSLLGVTAERGMEWPEGWKTPAISAVGVFQTAKLSIGNDPQRQETVLACIADPGFFGVLGVGVELGRPFNAEDAQVGSAPVAIVSDAFWKSHFLESSDLSGTKVFAAGRWIQVVGVLPAKVTFPAHAAIYLPHPDQRLFIGTSRVGDWSPDDFSRGFETVIARMRPGFTVAQANGMEKALVEQMRKANTDPHHRFGDVGVRSMGNTMTFRVKGQVTTIAVAGLFVGLVGLFSLLFMSAARAAELRKDVAIRIALGAERVHLFRHEI